MTTPRADPPPPQSAPLLNRLPTAALMCAAALLAGVALAWAQSDNLPVRNDARNGNLATGLATTPRGTIQRIREGTEISAQLGYFRMTGDRVSFFTDDGSGRFIALENLNLERIARTIADNSDRLQWDVTGTVTEFRGANYLFVRRAVLKDSLESEEHRF